MVVVPAAGGARPPWWPGQVQDEFAVVLVKPYLVGRSAAGELAWHAIAETAAAVADPDVPDAGRGPASRPPIGMPSLVGLVGGFVGQVSVSQSRSRGVDRGGALAYDSRRMLTAARAC